MFWGSLINIKYLILCPMLEDKQLLLTITTKNGAQPESLNGTVFCKPYLKNNNENTLKFPNFLYVKRRGLKVFTETMSGPLTRILIS